MLSASACAQPALFVCATAPQRPCHSTSSCAAGRRLPPPIRGTAPKARPAALLQALGSQRRLSSRPWSAATASRWHSSHMRTTRSSGQPHRRCAATPLGLLWDLGWGGVVASPAPCSSPAAPFCGTVPGVTCCCFHDQPVPMPTCPGLHSPARPPRRTGPLPLQPAAPPLPPLPAAPRHKLHRPRRFRRWQAASAAGCGTGPGRQPHCGVHPLGPQLEMAAQQVSRPAAGSCPWPATAGGMERLLSCGGLGALSACPCQTPPTYCPL